MARGETVYLGPASNSSQFFTDNGYPLPEMENPADHFRELPSISSPSLCSVCVYLSLPSGPFDMPLRSAITA